MFFVNGVAYTRIHLILAFLGLYIAGMLSMSHFMGMQLPCGIGSGCDIVTQDSRSKYLGIPFAYYGLAGYSVIAVIAILGLVSPSKRDRFLSGLSYLTSGIGLAVSIGLTTYSLRSIHAFCTWCIASAITMSLLFSFHAFAAMKANPRERRATSVEDVFLLAWASLILICALMISAGQFRSAATSVQVDRAELNDLSPALLCPQNIHRLGPAKAKFTIVFFGDLTCPVCENAYQKLTTLMETRHDFQMAFRHLPLEFHPLALPAAKLSEMAAEKSKFWEYTKGMYEGRHDTLEELISMAVSLGAKDAAHRLQDLDDPASQRVRADLGIAHRLGLHSTPSIFLISEGYKPEPCSYYSIETLMDNVNEQDRHSGRN